MSGSVADTREMSGASASSGAPDGRRWWVLAIVGVAQLMIVLDVTIMNIALPSAQRDLGFSNDVRQWIVTAYSLAFGSLLLLGGRLSDLVGRKITFLIGLVGFAGASALGGAAQNFEMLTTARAIQGLFGALLAPAALSLLTTTFGETGERDKAFAVYGAIAGAGGAVGLLLGGLLTEYLDWRWCLYVNVILAVFAFIGALSILKAGRPAARTRLDLLGTALAVGGLFCLVYGLSNAETHSWGTSSTWGFLVASAVILAVFVVAETRVPHPMLPLRIPGDRGRGGSYLAIFITGAGMFGVFLFLTYYLQDVLRYSPVKTGVAFLPTIAGLMVAVQLATVVLLPRIGPRIPVAAGMLLAAGGMAWLTEIGLNSSYAAHVLPQLVMVGFGLGLVFGPAFNVATLGVPPSDAGVASAMVNTSQQVGGSIGIALLSTLATTAANHFAAGKKPTPLLAAQAAVHSYQTAFWWSAGIFAAGAIICGLLLRPGAVKVTGPAGAAM
jgi:EmrB/QacA subfamily drug resistance transporter